MYAQAEAEGERAPQARIFCLLFLKQRFLCLAGSEQLLCVSYFFSEKCVTRFLMSRFLNTRN